MAYGPTKGSQPSGLTKPHHLLEWNGTEVFMPRMQVIKMSKASRGKGRAPTTLPS